MTDYRQHLETLADGSAHEKTKARAAGKLVAAGLQVVMNKERTDVQLKETLEMWDFPATGLETWGSLPIVAATEALPVRLYDLDPTTGGVLTSSGYNPVTRANWGLVPIKHTPGKPSRALVSWAAKRGRLSHIQGDAVVDYAASLAHQMPHSLKQCEEEATEEELEQEAHSLRGGRRATAHYFQQEAAVRRTVTAAPRCSQGEQATTLTSFFVTAFGTRELRRFIAYHAPGIEDEVAWEQAPRAVAYEVATALIRRGMADRDLAKALSRERPGRKDEIWAIIQSNPRM